MKKSILRLRYYLEIVAVPAFIFLVVHLAGHGLVTLLDSEHDHSHEHHHEGEILEKILTVEVLGGLLLLILFTWLWHRPQLKKWVPCAHDSCKHKVSLPHTLAIIALCLHFFPEAGVRHELLHHALEGEIDSFFGFIGFAAHFLIDILVAITLSSYWKTKKGFWLSMGIIAATWFTAFHLADQLVEEITPATEAFVFLVSAFLLCMFIHKPHKPGKSF